VLFVFLGLTLLVLSGCQGSQTRKNALTPPEALLQARIDEKFTDPQPHFELARIYHQQHQWVDAENQYQIALRLAPGNTGAQAGYVKMQMDMGDKVKAQQFSEKFIAQAANSAAESLRLAQDFKTVGMDDLQLRCLNQALTIAPDSAEVNKQVGFYYWGKGDTVKAKDHLSRSFQANPNQPDVARTLGTLGVVVQTPREPEPPLPGRTTK
jgi:Tfp pilus assembly protein PilF